MVVGGNNALSRRKYPSDVRIHTKIHGDQYRDGYGMKAGLGEMGLKIGVGQRGERYVEHTFGFFAI